MVSTCGASLLQFTHKVACWCSTYLYSGHAVPRCWATGTILMCKRGIRRSPLRDAIHVHSGCSHLQYFLRRVPNGWRKPPLSIYPPPPLQLHTHYLHCLTRYRKIYNKISGNKSSYGWSMHAAYTGDHPKARPNHRTIMGSYIYSSHASTATNSSSSSRRESFSHYSEAAGLSPFQQWLVSRNATHLIPRPLAEIEAIFTPL